MSDTGTPETSPKNQVPAAEQQSKKETSYTYWVNNDPNFFKQNNVNIQPKKVDESELQKLKQQEESKVDGHSAWNTAGTWEEKKLNDKIFKEILEKYVVGYKVKTQNVEIASVESVTGEGRLIVSRGKKRIGFELSIKLEYKGLGDLEGGHGTISYTEFQEDGDHEHSIEAEGEENSSACKKAVESSLKEISELVLNTLLKLKE